jgi:hypothetical protein
MDGHNMEIRKDQVISLRSKRSYIVKKLALTVVLLHLQVGMSSYSNHITDGQYMQVTNCCYHS